MKKIGFLSVLAGLATLLASCQGGPVPLTPNLISVVGPENVEQFYFYLSKDVVLQRVESYNGAIRFQDGVAIPTESDMSERVTIKKNTPGVALKNILTETVDVTYTYTKSSSKGQVTLQRDGEVVKSDAATEKSDVHLQDLVDDENAVLTYQLLGVSFEDNENCEIGFAAMTANPDGTFDMLFDDEAAGSILYEGKLYKAIYKGEERPYLNVRLGKGEKSSDRSGRVAKGAIVASGQ
jgi:hypothetical protein